MKTAREYIMEANEGYPFYDVISNLTEDQIIDAMKEYANQIAVQSLIDSAISYGIAYEKRAGMPFPIEDYQLLISTKIKQP